MPYDIQNKTILVTGANRGIGKALVGEALVAAMAKGEFHVFPDSMAKQIGEAYAGFADGVIEAAGGEG